MQILGARPGGQLTYFAWKGKCAGWRGRCLLQASLNITEDVHVMKVCAT